MEAPSTAEVSHVMLERLVQWASSTYSRQELRRVRASTRLSSSACLFEWVVPLCLGHSIEVGLRVLDADVQSGPSLVHVNCAALPHMLADGSIPPGVAAISIHGKAPSPKLLDELWRHHPDVHILHTSGGAEHCYCAIASSLSRDAGGSLSSTQHRLLDCAVLTSNGDLAPTGWRGELHVSEPSRGAHSRKRRSGTHAHLERLAPHMQRTGLHARVMPDGTIGVVGAAGNLVRSHGYLLDLAELERQAELETDVSSAIARVIPAHAGDELVVLVTDVLRRAAGSADIRRWLEGIRERLGARLPSYMVPARIELLGDPHSGFDLPAVTAGAAHVPTTSDGEPPASDAEMEAWLIREWASISGTSLHEVDVGARFLSICASIHSIIRISNRIAGHWQINMSPADIVEEASLRSLTRSICALLALQRMAEAATKMAVGGSN
jgi:acyl-CoA synthetase (AMP-forming)/AMP-acid ligase II